MKLEELANHDLPEAPSRRPGEVKNTPADMARVAKTYLFIDRLVVVIVGDRATIEAPVRAANLGR